MSKRTFLHTLLAAVWVAGLATGAAALGAPNAAEAAAGDVTMAAFGDKVVPAGTNGDTWDSAWLANDQMDVQLNDGTGFGSGSYVHDKLAELTGTPENPSTLGGTNLNPGTLGSFLGGTYSTSIYEVDGALYHIICYSVQQPGAWVFRNASILKSTDGGANWVNASGAVNTLPADSAAASTFPDANWGEVNFVKYGKGGAAPNVDNAQTYVYFSNQSATNDDYFLARVRRSDLSAWTTTFDRTKIEYYKGGDGMLSASWSPYIADAASIYNYPNRVSPTAIVYNEALGRYIATPFNSDSWLNPPIESSLRVMQAPHPWGPWTDVLDENMNTKEGDNLTWSFLTQKFTSADGQKMWMTTSGRAPYGLQFIPVYLTTNPVQKLEGENAALTGTSVSSAVAGYSGTGYATGLDAAGDKVQFNADVVR